MSGFQIAVDVKTEIKPSIAPNLSHVGYRHISQEINRRKRNLNARAEGSSRFWFAARLMIIR
jgi:hypothetical protein